jgi:hypothetical protein
LNNRRTIEPFLTRDDTDSSRSSCISIAHGMENSPNCHKKEKNEVELMFFPSLLVRKKKRILFVLIYANCNFCLFSNNGGGGERVLWVLIHGLLQETIGNPSFCDSNHLQIVIYNGGKEKRKKQILDNVEVTCSLFMDDSKTELSLFFVRKSFKFLSMKNKKKESNSFPSLQRLSWKRNGIQ